jgi:hypothetical protein
MKRLIALCGIGVCLSACVDLKEVREFASESAKFSTYTELTTHFRDTYEREKLYLDRTNAAVEATNDAGRKEVYPDLIKLHDRVALYLKTLAKLAGDDTFDLSKSISTVGNAVKGNPSFGIESQQVDAYAKTGTIIAKWVTSGIQQRAVRDMLLEGKDDFEALLEGMDNLLRLYKKTHENEKKIVLGFLEISMITHPPQDPIVATLAKAYIQDKQGEYSAAEAKYDAAEKGIKKVAEGHAALCKHAQDLSADELKTLIKNLSQDIQALRVHLQAARS